MAVTALAAAFDKAGLTVAGKDLSLACAKYFNDSHASLEEFGRIVSQVRAKMAENGHMLGAPAISTSNPGLPPNDLDTARERKRLNEAAELEQLRKWASDKREKQRERSTSQRQRKSERRIETEKYAAEHGIPIEDVEAHKREQTRANLHKEMNNIAEAFEKAVFADRIIEMLDVHLVNGRKLGDCTKSHLMIAAGREKSQAIQHGELANFYSKLAASVPEGQTLRSVNDRTAILTVLQEYFGDSDGPEAA